MRDVYETMQQLCINLPEPPARGGLYSPVSPFGGHYLYCSGCGPQINGQENIIGTLGKDLGIEDGQKAAYNCTLNLLANLHAQLGDLNRIKRFVKILAFVHCTDDFGQQPQVVDAASKLLNTIFGDDAGLPARSAIGTNALPGGIACEIEVLVEIKD